MARRSRSCLLWPPSGWIARLAKCSVTSYSFVSSIPKPASFWASMCAGDATAITNPLSPKEKRSCCRAGNRVCAGCDFVHRQRCSGSPAMSIGPRMAFRRGSGPFFVYKAQSIDELRVAEAGARPNIIPVSTSTGRPPCRYGLNFQCCRASVMALAWSGNALRK